MPDTISNAPQIAKIFEEFCIDKKYQLNHKEEKYNIRLEVSNGICPITVVNIYHKSNKIVIQGTSSTIMSELQLIKRNIEKDCDSSCREVTGGINPGNMSYSIISADVKNEIKKSLNEIQGDPNFKDNQNEIIEYIAKIRRDKSLVTITQFTSGKLIIQGRSDKLFHDSCDHVEKIIKASQKDVISRFIQIKEGKDKLVDLKITSESISKAEAITKEKLGEAYFYLDEHDKKLIIAARCLCLAEIPLPEYSPLVMPASKAFEGYVKKLTIDLGLVKIEKIKTKRGFGFEILDNESPERQSLCKKDKHIDPTLKRLSSGIRTYRHFMMHSDDCTLSIINNYGQAEDKIDSINLDIRETYYFLNSLGLISSGRD